MAVGNYYQDFTQVTDEEVAEILKESGAPMRGITWLKRDR